MIYLLYGQPGSGKTTLGKLLAEHLQTPFVIDGDEFRGMFENNNYSVIGRQENIKNANAVATYLNKKSTHVVICLVSPYEHLRKELRSNNEGQVIEILLMSDRELRKEHHVEDFEDGTPNHEMNTDRSVEDGWRELRRQLEL